MKNKDKDILNSLNLQKMPYDTPEGYFEDFKNKAKAGVAPKTGIWGRMAPYAGMAAAFLFIFMIGKTVTEGTDGNMEITQEDYLVFTKEMPIDIIYGIESEYQVADAAINEEDVISYLIYSGISAEEIEQYK